ncbi:MAG TPA: flotillin family protein [Noviherbaspirillum sp.]
MLLGNIVEMAVLGGLALFGLVVIGMIFARLYKRASKETAFVRTGLGGQKVIMDGGAIVLPIFHELILVNMNTLKLEVRKQQTESLITKDRMRVDVVAGFFVRVKQTTEAISTAAQTLGQRTMDTVQLKALVEDKFVDALRATAASMTMQELQDKRRDFVQEVQNAVAEDLEKNGLELESVSLTSLDQTELKYFNPDNAFDAEGLTRLTQETQQRRKQRNDIEQDTEVQVRMKNLEASRQKLTISKEEEFAKLNQERDIATATAEQNALVAQQEAARTREAEEAKIEAERAVNESRIVAERSVKEAEIEKQLVLQSKQIDSDRQTKVKTADQRRAIEIANQETQIAIANKSREQSEADAAANQARAEAVKAEEGVVTAREVAAAEREKQIQLIDAAKDAEQQAIAVRVSATAEKEAAQDRADAIRVEADAKREAALAEAEGRAAINEALNRLSQEQIMLNVRMELIRQLPAILEKATKPMEKIDSIRLFQLSGLQGAPSGAAGVGLVQGTPGATLPEQVVNAALQYQVGKPVLDAIMKDAGLGNGSITSIAESLAALAVPTVPGTDSIVPLAESIPVSTPPALAN